MMTKHKRLLLQSSGIMNAIKSQSTHHSNQRSSNVGFGKNRHCILHLTRKDKAGCLDRSYDYKSTIGTHWKPPRDIEDDTETT